MASTFRYDFVPIQGYEKTAEGYLRIPARISRTGIQIYATADGGMRREYRPPEEVGDPESLKTFGGKAVTLEHPKVLLDIENTKEHLVGFSDSNVGFDGRYTSTVVTITDKEAIEKIESGEYREISAGYRVEFDEKKGVTPEGEEYDGIQRRIQGNHIALVRRGRAGSQVRLLMDSEDGAAVQMETPSIHTNGDTLMTTKVVLDGIEFDASESLALAVKSALRQSEAEKASLKTSVDQLQAKLDAQTDELTKLTESKSALQAEMDKLQGKADALEEQIKEMNDRKDSADIDSLVNARLQLINKALPFVGKEFKFDGLTDRQVQEAVIKATNKSVNLEGRSDEYVAARFDAALELSAKADPTQVLRDAVTQSMTVTDAADTKVENSFKKTLTEAWKQPMTASKARG